MLCFLVLVDENEQEFFETIYNAHSQAMFYVAKRMMHNDSEAEDAVHDAFLKTIPVLSRLKGLSPHKLKGFLITVTKNAAIDIIRKAKNIVLPDEETFFGRLPDPGDTALSVLSKIEYEKVLKAIDDLRSPYKEVLTLFYVYDLSYKDVASVLGRTEATVRQHAHRGKAILLNSLKTEVTENEIKR